MNPRQCRLEPSVISAAQSDRWTEALRQHAGACPVCAEVLLVEAELRRQSEVSRDEVRLAPADALWLRSRLEAQQAVLRPLWLVERWSMRVAVASAAIAIWALAAAV
jgi:hypothetical protein